MAGDDASDVCQDVMLSAFRNLRSYGGCRLSTWIYRIARRRIADHFRSPQRRHVPSGLLDDSEQAARRDGVCFDPEGEALGFDIRDTIARLGEPCRSVVLAYYLGELSVREIARDMHMPENTVKSHLHRGRARLREHLGGLR